MSTRLPPKCSDCGTTETGIGYAEDPRTKRVVCLPCALPNKDQRERVTSEALAELLRRFERENGHKPRSLDELAEWAPGKMRSRSVVALAP
jgi:adenylosuccinate synthase